ncbi:hypothetical protein ACK344_01735 [Aeromonas veronii]
MSKTVFVIQDCPSVVFYNYDWQEVIYANSFEDAAEALAESMYANKPDSELSDADRLSEASGMIKELTQQEVLEAAERGETWPVENGLVAKVQVDD